jgi:hypothetical protein
LRAEAVTSDYRFDLGVKDNCDEEIEGICAEAKSKLRGNGEVLKCLVNNFGKASGICQVGLVGRLRLLFSERGRMGARLGLQGV